MLPADQVDTAQDIQTRIQDAAGCGGTLSVQGNGTRGFLGRSIDGTLLSTGGYRGIIDYNPSELVLSVRAGTPLPEVEQLLAREQQMLAFEPPAFGSPATLGGTIACGLSGPRRPWCGAARDYVLGINCINGRGEYLRFGGQVMKNVAGYDLARTLTGSYGTLAVLLDIHLKVMPRPETELTLSIECSAAEAVKQCSRWSATALPLTAACHYNNRLLLRLSGIQRSVNAAASLTGSDRTETDSSFWGELKEQTLPFFAGDMPLWRIAVPATTPPLQLPGEQLLDWGGGLRWLRTDLPANDLRAIVSAAGGHATLFRGGDRTGEVFHPLTPRLFALHRRLKSAFDPHGLLNPGRMYDGL